jgi:hypothetical protein
VGIGDDLALAGPVQARFWNWTGGDECIALNASRNKPQ